MDKRLLVVGMVLFLLGIGSGEEKASTSNPVQPLKAEVKMYNGTPTLFLNGKPTPLLGNRTLGMKKGLIAKTPYLQKFSESGANVFLHGLSSPQLFSKVAKTYSSYQEYLDKWVFGKFQAPVLDKIIEDVPDALFLVFINTTFLENENPEWVKEHPEEMAVWPPGMNRGNRISICSELWKQEAVNSITEFVRYLRNSKYADRVVGYLVIGGGGEWSDYWDYSKVAQEAFKRWVKEKYNGDINRLRDAWKDDKITFDTITIPRWEELSKADCGIFYDPVKSQKMPDYLEYYTDMAREAVSLFAKTIKEVSNRESLVGSWGLSTFYPGWDTLGVQQSTRKTLSQWKILKDPNIDFFVTCPNYRERHAGGVYYPKFTSDGILLHGKLPIIEEDMRTFLTEPGRPGFKIIETIGDNIGHGRTLEESIAVLKRDFAGVITKPGTGIYWFGHSDGGEAVYFDHPEIFKTIKTCSEISHNLLGKDKKSSEIAVIFNTKFFSPQKFNFLVPEEFRARLLVEGLTRIGAPYDTYIGSDLLHPDFPFDRYKFYIFADTFYLSKEEREIIEEKVKRNGNKVLWMWASGLIDENKLSIDLTSKLTGIELDMTDYELSHGLDVYLIDYSHPITKGLSTNIRFGTRHAISPVLWCKDDKAVVLGEAVSTSPGVATFRRPGLCVKEFPKWTSIWLGAPRPPSSLLRNIARYAGCHIYDEGDDQIFASEKVLAIHTRYAGERTIKLPKKCDVYDPFQKKYIAKGVKEFKVSIPAATTELWILE